MTLKSLPKFSIIKLILFACCTLAISSCATDDGTEMGNENTDWYSKSNADPAAFGLFDAMTYNKKQTRRPPNDYKFYYKRCALDSSRTYYSRTSYWCTDPF